MCEWLSAAEWCDVHLVCGGRAFSAHRAVLASVSTFLKELFLSSQQECVPIVIMLPEFDIEAMHSVLFYVYNGEVFVTQNKLEPFLDIIKTLQIYVDDNLLTKTINVCEINSIKSQSLNLPQGNHKKEQLKIGYSEDKTYVKLNKIHRTLNKVKALYSADFIDSQMQCCSQNTEHKPLENLHSPNKDRQLKSCLRDSFIETYPLNCYANGPSAVPAMLRGDYLDPTFLINVKDYRTRNSYNGASAFQPLLSTENITNETTGFDNRERLNFPSSKIYEQVPNQESQQSVQTDSQILSATTPFTSKLMFLNDEHCNSKIESHSRVRERKFKAIRNAVQKNPWSTHQPICFKPFRRKNKVKIDFTSILDSNDSNNNVEILRDLSKEDVTPQSEIIGASETTRNLDTFKCRVCTQVFTDEESLTSHSKTHSTNARFSCVECGKTFSQLRNYKYHMSVHRGTKEFAATCSVCGKYFNDRGYLSSHMKIHRNRKEYKCPHCPKSFNQRVAYNMHVKIHTGIKPHVCEQCGKAFSRKMLLKQHQRTHSGERPYACAHCGKRFADRSNMTLHLRLHTGVKPFSCTLCPKAFTKKHHLKSHLNYHTGAKPYSCPHCKLSFTQSSNMRTHMKKCIAESGTSADK